MYKIQNQNVVDRVSVHDVMPTFPIILKIDHVAVPVQQSVTWNTVGQCVSRKCCQAIDQFIFIPFGLVQAEMLYRPGNDIFQGELNLWR